jgi:hypothetical protein
MRVEHGILSMDLDLTMVTGGLGSTVSLGSWLRASVTHRRMRAATAHGGGPRAAA